MIPVPRPLLLGIIVVFFTIDVNSKSISDSRSTSNLHAVLSGVNQFSARFYQTLAKNKGGNFICSPTSLDFLMSMVAYGTGGKTRNELQSALQLPADDNISQNGFQSLIDSLHDLKEVELGLANKVFIRSGVSVKSEFKDMLEKYFRSELQTLDFGRSKAAAETVNNWADEKTHHRIKNIVKPDDFRDAGVILTNALYFKGEWKGQFEPHLTKSRPFYIDDNTSVNVPMMSTEDYFNVTKLKNLDATCIELPYMGVDDKSDLSMYIIVPNKNNGLQNIENNLHNLNFKDVDKDKENRWVNTQLYLPKFTIESELDVMPIAQKMGIHDVFQNTANFSGINTNAPLKVTKFMQKAFIEVNEAGSEATAASTIKIGVLGAWDLEEINVNRPFLCVIVVKNTGMPLFYARVNNPKANNIQDRSGVAENQLDPDRIVFPSD